MPRLFRRDRDKPRLLNGRGITADRRAVDDLLRRIRDEVYHAKTLVRATRNHTKTTAAALQDSESRLDALIEELERSPHAQGGSGNDRHRLEAVG